MAYITPAFVSELETAHTTDGHADDAYPEDCVWCSGLMLHLAAHPEYGTPATHTEAERLRLAAGKPLMERGSNLNELVKGYTIRYRYTPSVISGFTNLWKALTTGKGAVVTGMMGNLPSGHRLRRYSPNYTGGHAVAVLRMDGLNRVWWIDPLAPQASGYRGEWVSSADLASFMASNATAVIKPLAQEQKEEPMYPVTSYVPGQVAKVTGRIRSTPDATTGDNVLRTVPTTTPESWSVVGFIKAGVVDGQSEWLVRWSGTRWEYTSKTNVVAGPAPAPDSTPYGEDALKAAEAKGYAEAKAKAGVAVAAI